jgi:hypothetical protein
MSRTLKNLAFTKIDPVTSSRETPPHRASCRRAVRVFLKRLSSLRRPTTKVATSPGTFVDSQYEVPVYYGYPPRPYTVLGMMEETSHGRHSNAIDDAAQEAKKLGADAVLVESHGSSSEPAAAFTNASISPIGSGAMVTGSTIIARHHTDRATVLVIKWL